MDPVLAALVVPLALVTPALVGHDLVERRLPNGLVALAAAGTVAAWLVACATGRGGSVLGSFAAGSLAAVVLGAAALGGALGMGDAKLGTVLVTAAALLDPVGPGVLAGVAALAGALTAVGARLRRRGRRARARSCPAAVASTRATEAVPADAGSAGTVPAHLAVPLGPALLTGWWAVVVAVTAGGATTVPSVVAPG